MNNNDNNNETPVVLATNEARAGVTGHHVRYVLAFGLAGAVTAFAVLGVYFGYGKLTQAVSEISGRINVTVLVSSAITLALAAVAVVLLLGLWDMISGRSLNPTQRFMRWRVVLQFVAICLAMVLLYLSTRL